MSESLDPVIGGGIVAVWLLILLAGQLFLGVLASLVWLALTAIVVVLLL